MDTVSKSRVKRVRAMGADVCTTCGEVVPVGGWPFCASERNPEGHTKGTYGWKMKMGMKVQGWTRRQE